MRLRLAFLANAFEFVDCVDECLQSLSEEELTLEDAFNLLDKMPEGLWEHEAARAIRIKIIKVLVEERDEQAKRSEEGEEDENAEAAAVAAALTDKVSKALRQAGEALGKALGSVDKIFEEGAFITGSPLLRSHKRFAVYKLLSLPAAIKDLSAEVMEVLLASETLQLRSENNAYYLLCAWLSQSPQFWKISERQARSKQLLPLLRFHHMSRDFLGAVVSACPYANAPDLLRRIMRRSHAPRAVPFSQAEIERYGVKFGKRDRSLGDLSCHFYCKLEVADLLFAEESEVKLGLAVGFPIMVSVKHEVEGTMGLFVDAEMPSEEESDADGEDRRYAGFEFSIKAGGRTLRGKFFIDGERVWGWGDLFRKPLEEVVCSESPYFSNGVLEMEMTATPIQREEEEEEEEEEN